MSKNIAFLSRRDLLKFTAAGAALPLSGLFPNIAFAEGPIKTAAIYTVPIEQQWVSRIHKGCQCRQGPRRY